MQENICLNDLMYGRSTIERKRKIISLYFLEKSIFPLAKQKRQGSRLVVFPDQMPNSFVEDLKQLALMFTLEDRSNGAYQ